MFRSLNGWLAVIVLVTTATSTSLKLPIASARSERRPRS
jgi:hypothetical protein